VDEVAERIRQLGAPSPGTLAEFTKTSRLKEHPASNRGQGDDPRRCLRTTRP